MRQQDPPTRYVVIGGGPYESTDFDQETSLSSLVSPLTERIERFFGLSIPADYPKLAMARLEMYGDRQPVGAMEVTMKMGLLVDDEGDIVDQEIDEIVVGWSSAVAATDWTIWGNVGGEVSTPVGPVVGCYATLSISFTPDATGCRVDYFKLKDFHMMTSTEDVQDIS